MSTHLPFDIQVQIIQKLPVKSLLRFRSVCKEWKSFIDCSEFVAGYGVLSTQPHHLLIRYQVRYGEKELKYVCFVDDDTFPQQKFAPTVPSLVQSLEHSRIIGSSHGLLCLNGYFGDMKMIVLWNPAIRKSIAVAVPNVVHRPFNCVIGFGVCPDTNDTKLVMITYMNQPWNIESTSCIFWQVMVFTLSSREWTCLCRNQLPRKSIGYTESQTVIGRFIYWLAYDWISIRGHFRNLIMSFDMSTQEFTELDLPDRFADVFGSDLILSRLRESLVLIEYSRETINKQICDVWMMEHGDSKAFTKLFTINPPNASVSRIPVFRNSGEPVVETQDDNLHFGKPYALEVYEPCSEHIRDLGIRGNRFSFFGSSYMESLLLLNHDDGQIIRC